MPCLDPHQIAELLAGRLAGDELAAARRHVAGCDACHARLSGAAAAAELEQTSPLALGHTLPSADAQRTPSEALRELASRRGELIDRYVVLDRVGAGAMGAVYAAYDPELDRKVALKLLRTDGENSPQEAADLRLRLVREGQAMARLSHPGVIAIFDVGMHGAEIFIAMELADGGTLRDWMARRRGWREVVALFARAGAGLQAAHDAGIVHRDFKPDNVLISAADTGEPRVRVTDFGLAVSPDAPPSAAPRQVGSALSAALTVAGSVVGTPVYMAPEQMDGRPGPRADQFSFCVTLYEALYGERPFAGATIAALAIAIQDHAVAPAPPGARVPRWLRRVVLRGLRADPAERYPSMTALLAALRADPVRRVGRLALGAVAPIAVIAAVLGWRTVHEARALECTGAAGELAGTWDPARRIAVAHAFLATGVAYAPASLAATDRRLDDYAGAWTAMHHAACTATRVRHEQSEDLLDLRMVCLDDHRRELRALVDAYAAADAETVEHAAGAARELAPIDECANARALSAVVPVPRDPGRAAIERMLGAYTDEALALDRTGKWARAYQRADGALRQARALGYPRRTAKLAYVAGGIAMRLGRLDDSAALIHEGAREAERAHDDSMVADAWTLLIFARGVVQGNSEEGLRWAGYARAAAERAGNDEETLAAIDDYEGQVLAHSGHPAEGLVLMRRMVEINERRLGRDDLWSLRAAVNMAVVMSEQGRYEEARDIFEHAMQVQARELGPTHPDTLLALENYGAAMVMLGRGGEVRALLERGLTALREQVGAQNPAAASAALNLAEALADDHRFAEAEPLNRDALAALEPVTGGIHPFVAEGLTNLGIDALGLGKADEAIAPLERALAVHGKLASPAIDAALTRFALARALIGRDPARARALASAARDAYAEAGKQFGGHALVRAREVEAWLAGK